MRLRNYSPISILGVVVISLFLLFGFFFVFKRRSLPGLPGVGFSQPCRSLAGKKPKDSKKIKTKETKKNSGKGTRRELRESREKGLVEIDVVFRLRGKKGSEAFSPVPGARVCFIDPVLVSNWRAFKEAWPGWWRGSVPITKDYLKFGRIFRADGEGKVKLPSQKGGRAFVLGDKEDLWGMTVLEHSASGSVKLVLKKEFTVRVLVVDEGGESRASVPVRLEIPGPFNFIPRQVETGVNGIAVFRHVQAWIEKYGGDGRALKPLFVHSEILDEKVPWIRLEPGKTPPAPVRLEIPKTGSLIVRVDGPEVVRSEGIVTATIRAIKGKEAWYKIKRICGLPANSMDWLHCEVKFGRARFPFVAVGKTLEIKVEARDDWGNLLGEPRSLLARGPSRSGEVKEIQVRWGPLYPVLEGRLKGPNGFSLWRRVVDVRIEGSEISHNLVTEKSGFFRLSTGPSLEKFIGKSVFFQTIGNDGLGQMKGKGKIARDTNRGVFTVGEVEMHYILPFFSGRVVDGKGEGIQGAFVEVCALGGKVSGTSKKTLETITDARGEFFFYGSPIKGKIRVKITHYRYAPLEKILSRASRDIRIGLSQGGEVGGSLLVPPGVDPARDLVLVLVVSPLKPKGPTLWIKRLKPHGDRFLFKKVPPGKASLALFPSRGGFGVKQDGYVNGLLASLDGIHIKDKMKTIDPRLSPWDLRGKIEPLELEIKDRLERHLAGILSVKVKGFGIFDVGLNEKVKLPLPPGPQDLEVSAPFCKTVKLFSVQGRCHFFIDVDARFAGKEEFEKIPRGDGKKGI